jgi:hypothetical protein
MASADSAPVDTASHAAAPHVPELLEISVHVARALPALTKRCIVLGTLGQIAKLRDDWNGLHPEDLPFDSVSQAAGDKPYATMQSFSAGAKGHKDPVSINTAAYRSGISVFESLARVLVSYGSVVQCAEQPFRALGDRLGQAMTGVTPRTCTRHDIALVRMMIAIRGFRVQTKRAAVTYCGTDRTVLKLMDETPGLKNVLDGSGHQMAQLFVDFYRTIGEMFTLDCWEKRGTLNEAVVFGKLRTIGYFIPDVEIGSDEFHSIWKRASVS